MKKETIVISLGGSLIIPNRIQFNYLEKFKKIILSNKKKLSFVIVCGGGARARNDINKLKREGKSERIQSLAGIMATKDNAKEVIKVFKNNSNKELPSSIDEVISLIENQDVVITGALKYSPGETSDTTAAKIASKLKSPFINMSNTLGLYNSNPKENPSAEFIPSISWSEFERRAKKIKFKPGQHFVLDQKASTIIRKNKIETFLLGRNLKNLNNLLHNKKFIGTRISK